MACQLTLQGNVVVGGHGCGCDGGSQKIQGLSFACPQTLFQGIGGTDCAVQIITPGAPGDNFVELPGSGMVGTYQLLIVRTTAPVVLRVGAAPAELLGVSGSFPTSFAGGETFAVTVDGVAVAATFTSGDQSAAQVAARVNQAAIAAGLTFLPVSVQTNGQLRIRGLKTGVDGSLDITTANATIGFPSAAAEAIGGGVDQDVNGLLVQQFPSSAAPTRIQISGSAQVEVLAAGTAPS